MSAHDALVLGLLSGLGMGLAMPHPVLRALAAVREVPAEVEERMIRDRGERSPASQKRP